MVVYNYVSPIFHNEIALGYDVLYNLLDCGNDKIGQISVEKETIRN